MVNFKITIIGAGAIGLAIAYKLSEEFDDILVLEKNAFYGLETSSRNSEVIHAGIYYPPYSLKAKLCVEGRRQLYEFLEKHNVSYKKLGKLIVGNSSEEEELINIYNNAISNGVENISLIDKEYMKKLEPNVSGSIALYSKETGIFDSHGYMKALYFTGKERGIFYAFEREVIDIKKDEKGYLIKTLNGEELITENLINAAGLYADRIAGLAGMSDYRIFYCKGDYFYYSKTSPVSRLIYPVPHKDLKGLGVHTTLDLSNRMKFGPDAYFVDKLSYHIEEQKKDIFYESANKLIKGLQKDFLHPDMSGIRPKLSKEGFSDFLIREERERGYHHFINLLGIESPGLTASLAIGDYVKDVLKKTVI